MTLFDLSVLLLAGALDDQWARLIQRVLSAKQVPFLAAALAEPRADFTPLDMPALAAQLMDDLDAASLRAATSGPLRRTRGAPAIREEPAGGRFHHADAPRPLRTSSSPIRSRLLAQLEVLDDAVYEAIIGDEAAMERLRCLWPAIQSELDEQLVADSREQYLRFALSIWEDCVDRKNVRDPARAMQALEVLCVLFDNA